MARWTKLNDKAEEYGEPLETLIPRMIEKHGSIYRAAVALDVVPHTIHYWLKKNGLTVETRYAAQVVRTEDVTA